MSNNLGYLLNQRCDIAPRVSVRSRLGQVYGDFTFNPDGTPVTKATDVPCRFYSKNVMEKFTDRSLGIVQDLFVIFFSPGTDIGESDRITEIRGPDGVTVAQNLDVTGVRNVAGKDGRLHHLEATAFEYRTGVSISWEND